MVLRTVGAAPAQPAGLRARRARARVVGDSGAPEPVPVVQATLIHAEPQGRLRRAETLAPQERLAALLGGSDEVLVAEELVLRARTDIDEGRPREAALQARVALEALLAELPGAAAELAPHRE